MELRLQAANPTTGAMAELKPYADQVKPRESVFTRSTEAKKAARLGFFKYYIHDGVESCRLQLIGELTETEVPDLTGCWNTVKTTLGQRKLVLDVCGLRATDETAKRWLVEMATEGAAFFPETYLRDGLAGDGCQSAAAARPGFFSRLLSLFRGSPAVEA
jgi:hypothetical protein